MSSKESLILGRLEEATLTWGKDICFRGAVVLEIVLTRSIGHIKGETFSSNFFRDCSIFHLHYFLIFSVILFLYSIKYFLFFFRLFLKCSYHSKGERLG